MDQWAPSFSQRVCPYFNNSHHLPWSTWAGNRHIKLVYSRYFILWICRYPKIFQQQYRYVDSTKAFWKEKLSCLCLPIMDALKIVDSLAEVSGLQVKSNFIDTELFDSALCRHEIFTADICIVQVQDIKGDFYGELFLLDIQPALISLFLNHIWTTFMFI